MGHDAVRSKKKNLQVMDMIMVPRSPSFLDRMGVVKKDVVCIVGAGGKTALMFYLANEAKMRAYSVLVSTTTKIMIPRLTQCDELDLSGTVLGLNNIDDPGVYVGGTRGEEDGKMQGFREEQLEQVSGGFDLLLIEGDGSGQRPLKGWNSTEPVVPDFSTVTIGVLDIQTVGQVIDDSLVHRLDIFLSLTGAEAGKSVTVENLGTVVRHGNGIFRQSYGRPVLFINKVESDRDRENVDRLKLNLRDTAIDIVAGSVRDGELYG